MERIVSIQEVSGLSPDPKYTWSTASGFEVVTDKQTIRLLIDDQQNCCESFGYFMSEDDLQSFVGAELRGLAVTDTALKTELLKEHGCDPEGRYYEGGILFVNLDTSKGLLQFTAYNMHNGYYGHTARVQSEQLSVEESL